MATFHPQADINDTSDGALRHFTPFEMESRNSESSFSIISAASTPDASSDDNSPPPGPRNHDDHGVHLDSLPAPSSRSLNTDDTPFRALPNHRHHTWARTFYSQPEYLISPESVEEVQQLVLLARRRRRRVVTVGSGHSPSDLTCTSSWMVTLKNLSAVHSITRYVPSPSHGRKYAGRVTFQAGISLHDLNVALARHGLTLPNLGSIDVQSVAGAIATGTHGSSLQHGLLSESVRGLRIVLADGRAEWCTVSRRGDLFRAALVSLGALGIITDIEMEVAEAADIEWEQRLESLDHVLEHWNTDLWTQAEFVRCWWMPYGGSCVVWKADRCNTASSVLAERRPRREPEGSWYGGLFGFHSYRAMLWAAHHVPRLLPWIEWFVMGMQYGFTPGKTTNSAVQEQRTGLLMDCLYSQFVNEWAIPLGRGPEAIRRLDAWLRGDEEGARIPFSAKGLYVHSPVEVRVSDSQEKENGSREDEGEGDGDVDVDVENPRAYLDPTPSSSPTLYLNATLYRPFGLDPPCRRRYYEAFEWLMREMGGRPHWAKNFATVTSAEIRGMYGENLEKWLDVRREVDPDGMFVGSWLRRVVLGMEDEEEEEHSTNGRGEPGQGGRERALVEDERGEVKAQWVGKEKTQSQTQLRTVERLPTLLLEERQVLTRRKWWEGGTEWFGQQSQGNQREASALLPSLSSSSSSSSFYSHGDEDDEHNGIVTVDEEALSS